MDLNTITTDLGYAKLFYLQQLDGILTKMKSGCCDSTKSIQPLKRVIKALQWRVDATINDNITSALYGCMMQIIGSFGVPYVIDPNVKIPNTTVIVEGSVGLDLLYDATNLVEDGVGSGNYYLPLINIATSNPYPTDYRPSLVTVNGVSFTFTYDSTFTPIRIYGFSDNTAPKNIIVTVVTT